MKLKNFANIDLSTPEARKEIIDYLTKLRVDINISESTPEEIIACADSMLSILWCLAYSFPSLFARYYDKKDEPEERVMLALFDRQSYLSFVSEEHAQLHKIIQFSDEVYDVIPEIRKIAKKLCEYIEYYAPFRVKVTKYNVLIVN